MNHTPLVKYFEAKDGDENTAEKQISEWFKSFEKGKTKPILTAQPEIKKQVVYIQEDFKTTVYNTCTIQYFELSDFAAQNLFNK